MKCVLLRLKIKQIRPLSLLWWTPELLKEGSSHLNAALQSKEGA